MSLNGLEAVEVNEAYQSALGEGGGWFVIHKICLDGCPKLMAFVQVPAQIYSSG